MSRTVKPLRYRCHRYRCIGVKKWYRTNGNRSTRHRAAMLLRRLDFDPYSVVFPHPKLDAFDRWSLD